MSCPVFALEQGDISAKSAVVMNTMTGEVVFEKNSHECRSMASTTKIMTAVLAAESGRLDETVNITGEMCDAEGTSIGLKVGYQIKFLDLIYGMMLESGNDAANATAVFLSGSLEKFAEKMNEKAKQIGMTETNFVTPSGLDAENHYTTAYDMALLGAYAMDVPILKEICSTKNKKVDFIKPDITLTFSNHNRLLRSYEGAFGIKTGFTKKSGRCLVSAAERGGARFVAVTLSAGDDWNDHRKMLDYAFESVKKQDVYPKMPKTISVIGAAKDEVSITVNELPITLFTEKDGNITQKIYLSPFVYAPVSAGDSLGKVEIYYNNKLLKTSDIYACEGAEAQMPTYMPKKSIIKKIKEFFISEEKHGR